MHDGTDGTQFSLAMLFTLFRLKLWQILDAFSGGKELLDSESLVMTVPSVPTHIGCIQSAQLI